MEAKFLQISALALATMLLTPAALAEEETAPTEQSGGYGMMGPGYGMDSYMMEPGYGMGPGMGPGMMGPGYGMGPGPGYGYGHGMMGPGCGFGHGMMGPRYGMGPGLQGLKLSDKQRDSINDILDKQRQEQQERVARLQQKYNQLQKLYAEETPDPKAIGQAYEEVAKEQRALMEARVQTHNQIYGLLTDEQKKQLRRGRWGY